MTDDNLTLQAQAETETEMPMAFVEHRPVYTYPNDQKPPGVKRGRFERGPREEVKGKTTTIRIGICPNHNRRSMDFVGVDLHGWLFHCKTDNEHEPSHYFHNKPAE